MVEAGYPGQGAARDRRRGVRRGQSVRQLTQMYPVRLEDNCVHQLSGENGDARDGEGIFVGYRYYEAKRVDPVFPFGLELSYTSFDHGDLT